MTVKLVTEQNLEFLSLKGGCTGLSESIHVKMPQCWKSHALAQIFSSSANEEIEEHTVSSTLQICGFLDLQDIASPPTLSRHLVLPIAIKEKTETKTGLLCRLIIVSQDIASPLTLSRHLDLPIAIKEKTETKTGLLRRLINVSQDPVWLNLRFSLALTMSHEPISLFHHSLLI